MAIVSCPVEINWGYGHGSPGFNIWHLRTDDPAVGGDFDDQVGWIQEFYETVAGIYLIGVTVDFRGELTGVGPDEGSFWSAPSFHVEGEGGGEPLSPGLAILVKWRAETGGRSGRGKTYLGPVTVVSNDTNGTVDEPIRELVADAAAALVESSDTAANGAVGIWSPTDEVLRDFVTSSVNNDYAFLRSRRD